MQTHTELLALAQPAESALGVDLMALLLLEHSRTRPTHPPAQPHPSSSFLASEYCRMISFVSTMNKYQSFHLTVTIPVTTIITTISSVQSLSHVCLFATLWTPACQASLSITNSQSLIQLIKLVMPSNRLFLCHPLLLLPSIFPSVRVFSNESVLCIRWPEFQLQHQSFQ